MHRVSLKVTLKKVTNLKAPIHDWICRFLLKNVHICLRDTNKSQEILNR